MNTVPRARHSRLILAFAYFLRIISVEATMRSACLAATLGLAAAATDVSPPTISLNLVDGSPVTAGTTCEVQDATVTRSRNFLFFIAQA